MKICLPKYRIGQKVYLYISNGCMLVSVLEFYNINDAWYYDVDCSNYATGMELAGVHENMLGVRSDMPKNGICISSQQMDKLYNEMTN